MREMEMFETLIAFPARGWPLAQPDHGVRQHLPYYWAD